MSSNLSGMERPPSLPGCLSSSEMSVPKGLPTYIQAVRGPDVWALVVPYLDRRSVLAASRLNHRLHYFSTRELWIDPVRTAMGANRPWSMSFPFTKFSVLMIY